MADVQVERAAIWIHALGAKAGGGVTYLEAALPELFRQLDGTGVRVVLLVSAVPQHVTIPTWCDVHVLRLAARNWLTRLVFDQVVLPLWLLAHRDVVLYCSGSFPPFVKTVPTVVLVRNAIYFEPEFLRRERPLRRLSLRLQAAFIRVCARECRAIHYPSRYMRGLVESGAPGLAPAGLVNYYGIRNVILEARGKGGGRPTAGHPPTFLYVMNYTLQKNLGFLLKALATARERGLRVRAIVTSWLKHGPRASAAGDRALIARHDLVDSAYLVLVGPRYREELAQLYQQVDACLFPSICESFGHPLVEALAVGKPIICADRPYAREICGDRAVYVDPDRPEDLVRVWEQWPAAVEGYLPPPLDSLTHTFSWSSHVSRLLESLLPALRT